MSKVVIIGPAHPLRGGLATYNERLARAFQEQGDEVELVTFTLQYPGFLFPGQTQFTTDPAPAGLPITKLINSVNPVSWVKTGMYLKKKRPDIVIFRFWLPFMGPALGTIARIIARNKHTRILAITDNVIPHEKRIGDRPLTKYFLSSCHGFITMSKSVLDDLKQFEPAKPAKYNPHPLYDNFGNPKDKKSAQKALNLEPNYNYILFFGFIRAYKGLDLMLKAFADKRLEALPLKLIIAGEFYEDAAPYNELIHQLNLENRIVRATDFIPNDKVVDYFCASDMVVQPYKQATQSGVSQIAYHFNKPMLVTDVGGLAELIPDGEVGYVTAADPLKIADAIVDFYARKREQEFSENVRKRKQLFSWEAMIETIREVAKAR